MMKQQHDELVKAIKGIDRKAVWIIGGLMVISKAIDLTILYLF